MREALETTLAPAAPSPRPRRVRVAATLVLAGATVFAGILGAKVGPTVVARFMPRDAIAPATAEVVRAETKLTQADLTVVDPGAVESGPAASDVAPVEPRVGSTEPDEAPVAAKADGSETIERIEKLGDKLEHRALAATARGEKSEKSEKSADRSERAEKNDKNDKAAELKRLVDARNAAKVNGDASMLKKWAVAAYTFGDYRESRRATEAWALKDRSPEPRMFLARVLDTLGKRAEARAVLQEVLELHPDLGDARKMVAKMGAPMATPDAPTTRPRVARK
jgi:hypothetical protein